jgi:ElaA protein
VQKYLLLNKIALIKILIHEIFIAIHLFAVSNDDIIGYCRILPTGIGYDNYCSIGRVVIKKEARSHQYGKKLMQASIDFCKGHFEEPIKISAQLYLEKFYQNLGFKTVSAPYLEDNIPHIAMIYTY